MAQESTNTFSDGLIKDLNPLTTPNTVLTDALNATLLTFNGNELVLQNDMGNTKITGAKLPEGYVPLGIKEFGGILYIVSSNGENIEIGSFPSPEMVNTSLSQINPKTLNIFNSNDNEINKNIKLSTSSFKSGDNFLIILDTIQGESFISSDTTRKIYKPKLISISNGVELDITNTLTQQKNINSKPNYDSWFINGKPSEANINSFKSEKITQIYKSRKSGEIYLRFDLETLDKFYLNNTINNTSSYPVISRDESGDYHLKFSFCLKHDSYIKCNEISLKYTLTDLDSGENKLETETIVLAYRFIDGLTYDKNSIVYHKNIYYKALKLNTNKPLYDTEVWENLEEYSSASTSLLSSEPKIILKEYSEPDQYNNIQYNNIFDIDLGNTRNQLINYEITPSNTLFGIIFNDFTITDSLDLSKDNISWSLSPRWSIIPDFYNCELETTQPTGFALFNMIGRFGEDSSKGIIELDSNDLPLENNSKQAVLVRYGTSHTGYSNYNIIGYYSLDSRFRPLFNSGNIIQISENEKFREKSLELCGFKVRINYTYKETLADSQSGPSPSWPDWMEGNKAPSTELQQAFKKNNSFTRSASITAVYDDVENLLTRSETSPYYDDFGVITITPRIRVVDERWDYKPDSGWELSDTYLPVDYFTPVPFQLSNVNISTGNVSSIYANMIVNANKTGGTYNAGILYIRKLSYIERYQLTYDRSKVLGVSYVN